MSADDIEKFMKICILLKEDYDNISQICRVCNVLIFQKQKYRVPNFHIIIVVFGYLALTVSMHSQWQKEVLRRPETRFDLTVERPGF